VQTVVLILKSSNLSDEKFVAFNKFADLFVNFFQETYFSNVISLYLNEASEGIKPTKDFIVTFLDIQNIFL
jgi:hypothetical protein